MTCCCKIYVKTVKEEMVVGRRMWYAKKNAGKYAAFHFEHTLKYVYIKDAF